MATGLTDEQKFVFFLGPGGNGKSVLFEIIRMALGSYALKAANGTFMDDRQFEHPHTIARLMLARMIYLEENQADTYLKEGLIKDFSSGGTIAT